MVLLQDASSINILIKKRACIIRRSPLVLPLGDAISAASCLRFIALSVKGSQCLHHTLSADLKLYLILALRIQNTMADHDRPHDIGLPNGMNNLRIWP